MDATVLYNLTYGLYIIGVMDGERPAGCVINTCFQVTSENPILAISLNKNNFTLDAMRKSGKFSLSIVSEDTDVAAIGTFGFQSSRSVDKYADFGVEMHNGVPMPKGEFAGRLICDVIEMADMETHIVVFARLVDTIKGTGTPMTYAYYHSVVKGKAPKNAPTYRSETDSVNESSRQNVWVCDVCGYEYTGDELPEGFICPCCKMDESHFKLKEV